MSQNINVYLIISSSLNPSSKSINLANKINSIYHKLTENVELVDLRDYEIPLCNASTSFSNPSISFLNEKISNSKGIFVVSPIYNYDLNSSMKALIEGTGQSWRNKVVSLACVGGAHFSYMSPLSFINSLMLDFRCLILPNYVYCTEKDFVNNHIFNEDILGRISLLVKQHYSLSNFYSDTNFQ